ncbi:MAG: imidazole glycerol phosphate synthase subunit HisF [Chloroflexi bacterium]|nr:imidazole glycerol phosphate synthase subunit HisF [Chloroflexota bacterium]|tara:strand:- start:32128 stop:32883 length:756 start_codon:yes stop_codon:yes gene_type:complete
MLSKRIIPCLDIDGGRVVKGTNFVNIRDAGDPSELAEFYNKEGADELVFLDITATHEDRKTLIDVVRKVSSQVFIPLTVGGGIRAIKDMKIMLEAGADKVSINSSAISNPKLITECSNEFGSQCVVSAIDVKKIGDKWIVFTHGGRNITDIDVMEWVQIVEENGAGEVLLTSMDRDGSYDGYDLELLSKINEKISIPLIASGGAGKLEHLVEALSVGNADAVLAASIFHYGEFSIKQAKDFLNNNKIQVRL